VLAVDHPKRGSAPRRIFQSLRPHKGCKAGEGVNLDWLHMVSMRSTARRKASLSGHAF
jgi:hypothetical protein